MSKNNMLKIQEQIADLEYALSQFKKDGFNPDIFIEKLRSILPEIKGNVFEIYERNLNNKPSKIEGLLDLDSRENLLLMLETMFVSFLQNNAADSKKSREEMLVFYGELKDVIKGV